MGTDKKDYLMHTSDIINKTATHNDGLNSPISTSEVTSAINSSKTHLK